MTLRTVPYRSPPLQALLVALQSGDVLDHDVPEFRGITFTLDCTDELPMLAESGMSEHPPVDWRNLHVRSNAALAAAAPQRKSRLESSSTESPKSARRRMLGSGAREGLVVAQA